jgi:threonine aldolase
VRTIDLRSDTVTKPSPPMRRAMAEAEVGDDVYGEDPSVNALQSLAAGVVGKEAAIYVPSGTMANQAAVAALTRPGEVVLASAGAHVLRAEGGGAAAISGVQVETIGTDGIFSASDVVASIPPEDPHYARVTLLSVENTHNASGGRVFPLSGLDEVCAAARDRGLRLHLDGARLFNAVAATGIPAPRWTAAFDTVSFCLSKGLGAPVGSMVCGSAETIERVGRVRKRLGGSMRQAGIIAAAGIYALEHNVDRLRDDHDNAARLAKGLTALGLEMSEPETNMVFPQVERPRALADRLRSLGVLVGVAGRSRLRLVTHLDVGAEDIDQAIGCFERALRPDSG